MAVQYNVEKEEVLGHGKNILSTGSTQYWRNRVDHSNNHKHSKMYERSEVLKVTVLKRTCHRRPDSGVLLTMVLDASTCSAPLRAGWPCAVYGWPQERFSKVRHILDIQKSRHRRSDLGGLLSYLPFQKLLFTLMRLMPPPFLLTLCHTFSGNQKRTLPF